MAIVFPVNLSILYSAEIYWILAPPQEFLFYAGYMFYLAFYLLPCVLGLASAAFTKQGVNNDVPVSRSVNLMAYLGILISIFYHVILICSGFARQPYCFLTFPAIELTLLMYHGLITFELPCQRTSRGRVLRA